MEKGTRVVRGKRWGTTIQQCKTSQNMQTSKHVAIYIYELRKGTQRGTALER
jgi:hypothetical protein